MRFRTLLLVATALTPLAAHAGPDGAQVVGGSATVTGQGGAHVIVNQATDKAIINWRLFDIGVGQRATFQQPNSGSITLNRVTGGMGPSQIFGSLDANGKVFIINRDGIIFGAGAVINTAGFLATTSDIRNEDFMAGRFNFQIPGRPDASIVNAGTITASNGGFAALVAPGVRNSGTITATLGTVGLAAGNTFTLDFYGDKLITLGVGDQIAGDVKDVATGKTLKSLVTNDGKLSANGGRVELTAAAARQVVDSVINTSGVIEANSVGIRNGQIVLSAATADTKGDATPKQTVRVSGTLTASGKQKGTKGGKVVVAGENIEVVGATIDASGRDGGGTVMVGGDWGGGKPDKSLVNNQSAVLDAAAIPNATTVSVDAASHIDASAKDRGDGGKVILWADGRLSFAGTILALGGAEFGNGGFIETSGKQGAAVSGTVNGGVGGTWLLDPPDVMVDSALAASASTALNAGTNFIIATLTSPGGGNGDIFVNTPIAWNTSATLTLRAFRNVQISDGVAIDHTSGSGNLVVRADSQGTGVGNIIFQQQTNGSRINFVGSTGNVSFYYNPTGGYTSPTDFTPAGQGGGTRGVTTSVPGQFVAYMLVNTAGDLQAIGRDATTLSRNYALGRNIFDFSNAPNFAPIGDVGNRFTGTFDGLNNTISNLTIASLNPNITSIGLFGAIGATGVVQNLNITNASITANPNAPPPGQFIGVLAGLNGGTINNVTVSGTVSNGSVQNGIVAGGLVGQNGIFGPGATFGTITNALANVNVTVGNSSKGDQNNNAGGLAGSNPGTISGSAATGNVSGGTNSFVGGLVGRNDTGATITTSAAGGNVTISNSTGSGGGGLVGFNFGTISSSSAAGNVTGGDSNDVSKAGAFGGLVGLNDKSGVIQSSFAYGTVSAGAKSAAGGLVGFNNGSITGSGAAGPVSSLDNFAGGFAGFNSGSISGSFAVGAVSGGGFAAGGFVGQNNGTIANSTASGNVTDTSLNGENTVGGFAGQNDGAISTGLATGNVVGSNGAGGFAGDNDGTISFSTARGTVTVGNNGTAGGFVDANFGQIDNSKSFGAVTGGGNAILGGFAAGNFGTISTSTASGGVTSTGANSIVGGFAGVSFNTIANSTASGAVTGTSQSYLGGFTGINVAKIKDSTTTSTVTGSGSDNFAGGFSGVNFGFIDPSFSYGNVSSGPNSVVGSFVGANGALQFPDGSQLIGTVSADSGAFGTASGGAGSTVGQQVGIEYPIAGFPNLPGRVCDGNGISICGGSLFNPNGTPTLPGQNPNPTPDQNPIDHTTITVISPLLNIALKLVNQTAQDPAPPGEVVNTQGSGSSGGGSSGSAGGSTGGTGGAGGAGGGNPNAGRPPISFVPTPGLGPLPSGLPPLNEVRFAANEVVMQLGANLAPSRIAEIARTLGLDIIATQSFDLLGRTVYRFRITNGMPVRDVIRALEANGATVSAQPSYTFDLAQTTGSVDRGQGASTQYIIDKLNLKAAHAVATGKGVKIAVIDSEIDAEHPDLQGVIAKTYDALPSDDQTPHPHGTGMAGAIASHSRLLGIAPDAKLLAIRAFGARSGGAQGTSMNIVKGLEWAVKEGADIINMSFAGPRDPMLEQAIDSIKDKGVILIAAAGNMGPKSPPLFPAADKNVIAVSATDADNKTYKNANRGNHVAIAAPGVDILVPAPEGGYQLTTGTSVAAAHISGVVALLRERDKSLKAADVRAILKATARKLPQGRNEIGDGLIDPVQALSKVNPKQAAVR